MPEVSNRCVLRAMNRYPSYRYFLGTLKKYAIAPA